MSSPNKQERTFNAYRLRARRFVRSRSAVGAVLAAMLLGGMVAPQSASAHLLPYMRIAAVGLPDTITAGSQVVYQDEMKERNAALA